MVIDRAVNAHEVGKTFAQLVEDDDRVSAVWARKHRDVFEIWLKTAPVSFEQELEFYRLVDVLHDAFPQTLIQFRLINSSRYESAEGATIEDVIPDNADTLFERHR